MSTLITINVTNTSPVTQNFFFFQKPAIYVGGPMPYTNSLYNAEVAPKATSGALVTFEANMQYYAGVQQTTNKVPEVGSSNGFLSASWPIDLTPQTGTTNNTTTMSVSPLALSKPTNTTGVEPGAFRIVTSSYDSNTSNYFAGAAVNMPNGSIILSSYVLAGPNQNIDAQPILTFYVQTGEYTAGQAFNFTQSSSNAAVCDATAGYTTFNVTYDSSGNWHVNSY